MSDRIPSGPEEFDIAARDAQVSGNPRIGPMREENFSDEARAIIDQTRATFGEKDFSHSLALYATMFKHPGISRAQMQLGLELNRHGTLPPRERELAVLRVAWLTRSPFEWGEHVEYGKKLGLSLEEVERVTLGSDAPGWSQHDRAILRGVEELIGDHALSDQTWGILALSWDETQLIELAGLVGAYVLTALLYNSLRLNLLPGNRGLAHR